MSAKTEVLIERAKEAFVKVALWPEDRMAPDAVQALGAGFTDLLMLRNIVPELIDALEAAALNDSEEIVQIGRKA